MWKGPTFKFRKVVILGFVHLKYIDVIGETGLEGGLNNLKIGLSMVPRLCSSSPVFLAF